MRNVREAIQALLEARGKVLREKVQRVEIVEVEVPEAPYTVLA